uniref:Pyruvate, phosphate dikinase regulatory protein, chloroplastic n=1 Tax=Tanacetum cinerariifolium TaxID=118510 RepID=A0A6L2MBQ9_TANCI|nr:hypothetical protein [Tanacetum cinerariifolium]
MNESQYTTVQNSRSPALQDDLILSVIEQLKTQVERILKEQNNVDNASVSHEQSLEIEKLKHTLFENLKEKESLEQKVTLFTNDFQKEESRNIDRELALEKQVKELNNIVFKQNQSAQTVHMLTKPQFFYDHSTRQALVQHEEPNLSSSTTIVEVPKELPKVSMMNSSLKKIKFHLASFDMVVKERTSATAITEGTSVLREDTVIVKLKERLKSLSGNVQDGKIKRELEEMKTINIELDHRVTKLVAENEHLKQTYKQLYDSIKSSRIRSKEQCDDLIKQVNIKSAEKSDLNASLHEKVLVIAALKETLSRHKGKAVVYGAVSLHSSDPELLKIDVAPLAHKLRNNRTTHTDYLRHTQEETATT